MNNIEDIILALLLAKPNDLEEVKKYIRWMKFRRAVNDQFYYAAHWVERPKTRYHWVGNVDF